MNTMKRILCTTLLLLAGLHTQSVSADASYNPYINLMAPTNGSSYNITPHSGFWYAEVPISFTYQYVEIKGAAPSTSISVSWTMIDGVSTGNGVTYFVYDDSGGWSPAMTNSSGYWQRFPNNGSGNYSTSYHTTNSGSVTGGSSITGPTGSASSVTMTSKFSVFMVS